MKDLQLLSKLLDRSVPTKFGINLGLDGMLGLIPVVGDTITGLLSTYILLRAAWMGVPFSVLTKMAINIFIDQCLGALPIVGDLLDFAWESNTKNVNMILAYQDHPIKESNKALGQIVLASIFVICMMGLIIVTGIYSFKFVFSWISQS